MKLYIFRKSQAKTIHFAIEDGSVRFIGEFENQTKGDIARIEEIKQAITITAECIDFAEDIQFVEVTE